MLPCGGPSGPERGISNATEPESEQKELAIGPVKKRSEWM